MCQMQYHSAIRSLLNNPAVNLEFHLQQLMPAAFTCVVAAKLSSTPSEVNNNNNLHDFIIFVATKCNLYVNATHDFVQDHWALRSAAAEVIALIGSKYRLDSFFCVIFLCASNCLSCYCCVEHSLHFAYVYHFIYLVV